jgi:hypothetical protein
MSTNDLIIKWSIRNGSINTPNGPVAVPARHTNANRHGGYTIRFRQGDFSEDEKAAIIRALVTWRCSTGINFVVNPDASYNNNVGVTGLGERNPAR